MEYYFVSLNGAPLAKICDIELEAIKNRFEFVLIAAENGMTPIVGIDFYSDYKGNVLFVMEICEEIEND